MIRMVFLMAVMATACAAADGGREIRPEARERNHVLVVNVGGALTPEVFAKAVALAASKVQVNIWTGAVPASVTGELARRPEAMAGFFGERAKVCVFMERDTFGPSFLQAPGAWAALNVRGIK